MVVHSLQSKARFKPGGEGCFLTSLIVVIIIVTFASLASFASFASFASLATLCISLLGL